MLCVDVYTIVDHRVHQHTTTALGMKRTVVTEMLVCS